MSGGNASLLRHPEQPKITVIKEGMKINIPSHLTDAALVAEVKRFAGGEREAMAQLIAHLAELDARGLYAKAGFASMFTYCCRVLHLSEDAAYNRIETARAAHKFPVILARLAD